MNITVIATRFQINRKTADIWAQTFPQAHRENIRRLLRHAPLVRPPGSRPTRKPSPVGRHRVQNVFINRTKNYVNTPLMNSWNTSMIKVR